MTLHVGLLGWPVKHSISPAMHNAAFDTSGIDGHYDLLPVKPKELQDRVAELIDQGYTGFNVTVPHKKSVLLAISDLELSDAVTAIGAANTLYINSEGQWAAANTDWTGFLDDLKAHGVNPEAKHCIILGSGGSAQAVSYALQTAQAASIRMVSRTPEKHQNTVGYDALADITPDLIINCTPVGMWPHTQQSPWPDSIPFPAGILLYDLIYNPVKTALMKQSESAGGQAINGLGMLIRQGAQAFEYWTGQSAPLDVMKQAAQEALKEAL